MFDQIFDLCRLYGVARALRDIKIYLSLPCADDGWADDYAAEERNGIAILQREQRLENERRELLVQTELVKEFADDGSQLYILDEELAEVHQHYCAHQMELRRLWSIKVKGCRFRDFEMARKPQLARHDDKPWIWFQNKTACALSGGCCGRECGCCERPLRMFLTPTLLNPKKKTGIYGHCTTECGCCVKYIGAYIPDTGIEGAKENQKRLAD